MKVQKREQQIISLLETRGEISVNELSKILDCSVSTLRKQLAVMESAGLLIRTYGGAMSVNRVRDEAFDSKMHKRVSEKRRIAEKARSMIPRGSTVLLGSGSTVYALALLLSDLQKGVIYTNSMPTAEYLSHCQGLEVHVIGGIIRGHTGTIIGNETTEFIRNLKQDIDFAFIGCDAVDYSGEVYDDNLAVATAEKHLLMAAKKKFILSDSTKFGRTSASHVTGLKYCDGLITDNSMPEATERYKSMTKIITI